MNALLKNAATVATLAATALLLIADSEPETCTRAGENITFKVQENTCGEDGTLHLQVGQDSCITDVEVARELGLPNHCDVPETGALVNGGWTLGSELEFVESPDGGFEPPSDGRPPSVRIARRCKSTPGVSGTLRLECLDRTVWPESEAEQSEHPSCSAVLTQQ